MFRLLAVVFHNTFLSDIMTVLNRDEVGRKTYRNKWSLVHYNEVSWYSVHFFFFSRVLVHSLISFSQIMLPRQIQSLNVCPMWYLQGWVTGQETTKITL